MGAHAVDNTTDRWADRRLMLRERRSELVASALRTASEQIGEPLGTLGETEHLAAYTQRQLDAGLDAMHERELAEIDRALVRIDDGTYGTCESCGTEIVAERLAALPTAATCVGCQSSLR
jgi:RNA polymerase-binding transcription factor DksA